ncbi:MAG: tetratricopeptide repeat protein [Planctomycetota bacterium]|jgi:tetratricopeptide (TPR) repeat protein
MRTFRFVTLVLAISGPMLTLGACNGPTRAGQEARTRAGERIAAFSAGATFQQARQELIAGRFDRAIASAERAIAAQPDMPEYRILKGRALLESDRLEQAEESFIDAVEAAERSVALIDASVAAREEADGRPLEGIARERIDLQKRSVRRIEAEAWYYLGIVRQQWNRIAEAADDYRTAHERDPQPIEYLIAAAEMLLDLGRAEEVDAMVEPVLDRHQGDPSLVVLLARAAMIRDEPVVAAARYAEARLLRPEDALLTEEYIRATFEAELFEDCLDAIRTHAASYEQARPDLLRIEARCHATLGRPERADVIYRELVRVAPGDADAWVEYGAIAWELGDFNRLDLCGVRLQRLAPDRWESPAYRGLAAQSDERWEEAETYLRRAVTLGTDEAMPHLLLARFLESRGDAAGAEASWRRAMAIAPEDQEGVRMARERLSAIDG